jgi:cell wall-associated NlpC family hydrolase
LTRAKREQGAKGKIWVGFAAALAATAALLVVSAPALAGSGGVGPGANPPPPAGTTTAGAKAKLVDGFAIPPANAPTEVIRAIEAANQIVKGKPYCLGGGHQRRRDDCYDCSGTVSYALTGAGLLDYSMPSGSFMRWEERGRGRWITVYANGGHVYAVIAGLRLDTSMTAGDGPGWSKVKRSAKGFAARHPLGF